MLSRKNVLAMAVAGLSLTAVSQAAVITSQGSGFSIGTFTSDATVEISTTKTYTAKVDFQNQPNTINSVIFSDGSTTSGTNWSVDLTGSPTGTDWATAGGTPAGVTGSIANLLQGMRYTGINGAKQNYNLTNLTVGQTYEARFYAQNWGNASGGRVQDLSTSLGATLSGYAEDAHGIHFLAYQYVAPVGGQVTITFTQNGGNGYHSYGFSNEVVPEPAAIGLIGLGTIGVLSRRRRMA